MRISDWSSDVCSSDLHCTAGKQPVRCNSPQIAERRSCNRGKAEMEHRYEETHIDSQGARAGDNISKVDRVTRHRQQDWSHDDRQIGRASCRERVCKYVKISVVAVSLKKKQNEK